MIFKIIVIAVVGLIIGYIFNSMNYECVSGHTEIQYRAPMTINTGGVGIPLGNVTEIEIFVCDEYKKSSYYHQKNKHRYE